MSGPKASDLTIDMDAAIASLHGFREEMDRRKQERIEQRRLDRLQRAIEVAEDRISELRDVCSELDCRQGLQFLDGVTGSAIPDDVAGRETDFRKCRAQLMAVGRACSMSIARRLSMSD